MTTSLASLDLKTQTTGQLLHRSIPLRNYGSLGASATLFLSLLENHFVFFVQIRSKTVVCFFWLTVIDTLSSYRNSFVQCMYCTCFQYPLSSQAMRICYSRSEFSANRKVRSVVLPTSTSLLFRG